MRHKNLSQWRALASAAAVTLSLSTLSARTITTPDKVVYNVDDANRTLTVAQENSSIHRDNAAALTIPATVTDPESGLPFSVIGIESGAFSNTAITGIDIQASITTLPTRTFYGCAGLTTVTLPETLESIGSSTFSGCTGLQAPELHEGLAKIESYAFENCKSLGTLTLPSTVQADTYAFTGSHITQLNLPDRNNGIELSAYCFSNVTGLAEVKFPSWWTLVKNNTFYGCPDLLTVDFTATASGSLQIDNYAFSGCTSLSTVKFPAAIDYIGDYAFQKTSITEVNLPDANRIGNYSFAETKIVKVTWSTLPIAEFGTHIFCMTPIAEISFPAWMTRIPDAICYQCTSLTTVNLHEGVETIGRMAFGGSVSTLSMSEIKLPSTLKQIEDQAFIRQPLKQITFPDGLTSIGGSAFSNCQLSGVTVPASVKEIGPRAFASNKITSISLPEAENPAFTPISFGNYIFESNPITTYRFPAWMKSVPNGFFYKCQLTSVTFADGTYEICKDALRQNRLLEISEMPQTITHYGESCLSYCGTGLPAGRYLCSVYIGGGVQIDNMAFSSSKLREVIFTDCDYTLGDNIFMLVKSVSRIVFPECMTEIPDGICNGWENLTEVTWPPVVKHIGNQAFSGCKSLVFGRDDDGGGNVINLSEAPFEHLESIGNEAFARCNITGIIWPDENNIEIGNNLFSGISTLTQAHIPGWMNPVPDGLYKDCSNLSELIWDPSDRTSLTIGKEAFRGLGLSAIEWPDVPATFGSYAFAGNKQATEIKWPDSPVTLGTNSFYECTALTGPVSLPEYITAVPNGCFQKCSSLPEFTLHEGITSIGQYAFSECSSLRYFTADCELEEIPFNAFSSCGQLETFKAKSTVKQINDMAFFDCKSLRVIDMPDNNGEYLTSIGASAFENCEALESFPEIISASSKISYRAFYNTKSLKHITVPAQGTDNNGSNEHHFMNSGLEAIDIVASESNPKIQFFNNTFTNAPLRGVSYLRDDIPVSSITTLTGQTPRDTKGILMVNHDMKYRLMEAGYGDIWDIREMKTPRLKLYGDLHSTYTPGDTHNRYKAMIRWEIAESDLNENAPTVYHLHRDGVEIARIEFGVPEIREAVAEGNINRNEPTKVFPIKITRDGVEYDKSDQYGDFSYEVSENLYTMVWSNQHKNLYFHPETSHRIGLNEQMGATSWFLYIDEFDSPDLNQPAIPHSYSYTLSMDSYEYEEPVNNEGYTAGADGLYWHTEPRTLAVDDSEPCVVHTSIAVPSLNFDGLYTLDRIKADTDGSLPVSTPLNPDGSVTLDYAFSEPAQLLHKIKDGNQTKPIIDHITSFEVPSRIFPDAENEWTSISIQGDTQKGAGQMVVPAEKNPQTGSSFQIVTYTEGRGTFGSRIVTIPGAPDLAVAVEPYEHCWGGDKHPHDHVLRAKVAVSPKDLDKMGYNALPSDSQHSIGIWRNLRYGTPGAYEDFAAGNRAVRIGNDSPEELLFHTGDDHFSHSWTCDDCRQSQVYNTDDGLWTYTDHFSTGEIPAGQWNNITSDYRVRLYVQTPEDSSKWMIAEATASQNDIVTGVEHVGSDALSDPVYFNLQGIRILTPRPGDILIRVDRAGSHKIRF